MDIVKRLLRIYIDQWRKVIDGSTMEDALKMGLLGILLVIAGMDEAFHIF